MKAVFVMVILMCLARIGDAQDCDTVYHSDQADNRAELNESFKTVFLAMAGELNCRPVSDTAALKYITILIDKNGKAYAKELSGYEPDCKYFIRRKMEDMPKLTPAIRNKERVCCEEKMPVLVKR